MTAAPPTAVLHCAYCAAERTVKVTPGGGPRTPGGWKHHKATYVCGLCWGKRYLLRAVSMPVASPIDCSWEELRTQLKLMWRDTTRCANRIMTECYARDVRRNGQEKMPPMPRIYLYPELRAEFPALPSQTVASLEHACQAKYRAVRYRIVWTAQAALPTYRYPTPFPISSQAWQGRLVEDRPVVSVRLGEGRVELRLKSGHPFRRQLQAFRLMARGEAVTGEAAIYQRGTALMVKLVAWLPRPEAPAAREGVLRVSTVKDSLLVAVNAKDEQLWRYHGDHLRRWIAEHRRQLERWSDDQKYENRPVPSFAQRRQRAAGKFGDRMASAAHEIAAQLAGYAARRKFKTVEYDDTERGYVESFPWFRLRALLAEKLDAGGIEFIARGPVEAEEPGPLAED